jgi:hypothetical protein
MSSVWRGDEYSLVGRMWCVDDGCLLTFVLPMAVVLVGQKLLFITSL